MLHKNSASPLCDWQVKIFIFLIVYLTGSGSLLTCSSALRLMRLALHFIQIVS